MCGEGGLLGGEPAKKSKRKSELTSPSPPRLPNFILGPPSCAIIEGGLPPLADGWGIGDGECAGEGTRALFPGMGIGADVPC